MGIIAGLLMLAAVVLSIVGQIWIIVLAFQESIIWGLLVLVFAPAGLVFVGMHWEDAQKPFFIQIGGMAACFLGVMLGG